MNQGLFDNDILAKLVDSNLITDTQAILQISNSSVLSSLSAQLRPNGTGKFAKFVKTFPEKSQANLKDFVSQAHKLTPPENNGFVFQCTDEHSLDIGETLLLEAALRIQSPLLLTADKRFLNSIGSIAWLHEQLVASPLKGRLVCFEAILLQLIDEQGYEVILHKVSDSKSRISELKNVFGGDYNKTEQLALERLHYEMDSLRNNIGPLLYSHIA